MRLFPGVQLAFGPTTENGFYYDMRLARPLSDEDFAAIEAEMQKIVKANLEFERIEEPRERAIELCRELGQEFKVEHIGEGLADHATLSFYRQGEFIDLCRGRHVPSTGAIGAFKLLSVAGAIGKATNRASSFNAFTEPRSLARKTWTNTYKRSKRPSAATIACSASNWSCSQQALLSAAAWFSGCRRAP